LGDAIAATLPPAPTASAAPQTFDRHGGVNETSRSPSE
jgi:hypothetical protein